MINEVKTSRYEPLYTLTEAEKIISLRRTREARRKAQKRADFIWQRICGIILIIIGCFIPTIDSTAGMGAVLFLVIGISLIITRQMVMMFRR